MTNLLNNLQKGIITNLTKMTLVEWLDYYMLKYKKRYVKPTAYINYIVSDVKPEQNNVPVLHNIFLALRTDKPLFPCGRHCSADLKV